MKLKMTFIMAAMFAVVFNVKAQFTKTDGNLIECKPNDLQSVIGQDNNAFYIYKNDLKAKQVSVQRYNKKTLAKEWETALSIKNYVQGNKYSYLKNNQLYLYLPTLDKDKVSLLLFVLQTDGKVITDAKELFSVENTYNSHNVYNYALSPDSSKFIFYFTYSYNNKGTDETFKKAAAFDLKTGKQFDKAIPNTYQGSSIVIKSYAINNDGKIAYTFVYSLDVKEPTILDEEAGYGSAAKYANFWLKHDQAIATAVYNPANGDVNIKPANLKMTSPKEKIKIGDETGLYFMNNKLLISFITNDANDNKKNNSAAYIAQIDVNKNTFDFENFQYFSEAWQNKYAGNHGASIDYHYRFNEVDGGAIIITAFRSTAFAQEAKWTSDGIIFKINTQGKTEWMKVLPMNIKENYVNYTYYNKKMYYFFNDNVNNIKNIDITNIEGSKETDIVSRTFGDDVNTICISYDMSGNAQRTIIQNNKDFALSPLDKTLFLEKNKILLYFKKETQGKFSSLTIQ